MILLNVKSVLTRNTIPQNSYFLCLSRLIGTTPKSPSVVLDATPKTDVKRTRKNRNWQSYGFDYIDQRADIFWMHTTSFFLITGLIYGLVFMMAYYPDIDDNDWVHREAYIQLRRREILGLPIVDKNYTDPANIILPPDEEIGDDDIII